MTKSKVLAGTALANLGILLASCAPAVTGNQLRVAAPRSVTFLRCKISAPVDPSVALIGFNLNGKVLAKSSLTLYYGH